MSAWDVSNNGKLVTVREVRDEPGFYVAFGFIMSDILSDPRFALREVREFGEVDVETMRAQLHAYVGAAERVTEKRFRLDLADAPEGKTTLVIQGRMGTAYHAQHVRGLRLFVGPSAQYKSAIHMEYRPKGCRNARECTTYSPKLFVLAGWVDVEIPNPNGNGGHTTKLTRHVSFDRAWEDEAYLAVKRSGARVLFDFHGTNTLIPPAETSPGAGRFGQAAMLKALAGPSETLPRFWTASADHPTGPVESQGELIEAPHRTTREEHNVELKLVRARGGVTPRIRWLA